MRIPLRANRRRDGPPAEYAFLTWIVFTALYVYLRHDYARAIDHSAFGAVEWLPPALFGLLTWMHQRTAGRSSPPAALAFVLAGPVLGVCVVVPRAFAEQRLFEATGAVQPVGSNHAIAFVHTFICIALIAASLASVAYAIATYREWVSAHISFAPPPPFAAIDSHAPFFLAELGLDRMSTLDDLERAYRDLAQVTHPDRGGADSDFKRLQANYERAREYLDRRQPPGEVG